MKSFPLAFRSSICMAISVDSHTDLNLTLSNVSWEKSYTANWIFESGTTFNERLIHYIYLNCSRIALRVINSFGTYILWPTFEYYLVGVHVTVLQGWFFFFSLDCVHKWTIPVYLVNEGRTAKKPTNTLYTTCVLFILVEVIAFIKNKKNPKIVKNEHIQLPLRI